MLQKIAIVLLILMVMLCSVEVVKAEKDKDPVNITDRCSFTTSDGSSFKKAVDNRLSTYWERSEGTSVTFIIPEESENLSGIYIRWANNVPYWTFSVDSKIIVERKGEYYAQWIEIPKYKGYKSFTLSSKEGKMSILEISVYTDGKPYYAPCWTQEDRAHVMVISCHPDDECLYMAPWITVPREVGHNSVVVFMTAISKKRRVEAQESVWTLGSDIYPVLRMGKSRSSESYDSSGIYGWSKEESIGFIVEQIRKYKPTIVVTHDKDGEYGHASHKKTFEIVTQAVTITGDQTQYPESALKYGAWSPYLLYIHLYRTNEIHFDSNDTLMWCGKSTYDIAEMAFNRHKSQHNGNHTIEKDNKYWSMEYWGLYWICPCNLGGALSK